MVECVLVCLKNTGKTDRTTKTQAILLYYRPQRSWGKVIFFSSMCQWFCSRGGEYLGRYTPQAGTPPGRYTSPGRYTPQQLHPRQVHRPREQCMLEDTGNKRAVRILLECILVVNYLSLIWIERNSNEIYSKIEEWKKNSDNKSRFNSYDSAYITVDNNLFCHSSEGSIYGDISSD